MGVIAVHGEGHCGYDMCLPYVQVVKNKVAPPYKLAEFDIMFGSGISSQGCLLDAAEAVGIVSKKGSWYYYGEERLAQGRDKTLQELDERKDLAQ